MSAKRIMINPPKMLYIRLYCIQPNLYFGIIISVVNPPVDLMSALRIREASGISDIRQTPRISDIRQTPRISDIRQTPRISEVRDASRIREVRDDSRIREVRDDASRIRRVVDYVSYVSSYISRAPYIVLGFTYHSRSSLTL
jgi:hypothetical protein